MKKQAQKVPVDYLLLYVPFIIIVVIAIGLIPFLVFTSYRHLLPELVRFSVPFLSSFIIVIFITPLICCLARKYGCIDRSTKFKKDKIPTPLLGGVVIFLSFAVVLLAQKNLTIEMWSIFVGGAIIFLLGTMDDIYRLSSRVRLLGQLAATIIVMSAGLKVTFFPATWWGEGLTFLVTVFWVIGIINAMNFIDGADGLASGVAVISSLFFFLLTLHLTQLHVSVIAVIVMGAGLGFLCYNFKPAKIYLGDGGSAFLGFILAVIALFGGWSDKGPVVALGIPVTILSVLIFDMIYITISRIKNGQVKTFQEWLDYRGEDHFHHRLMKLGFGEREMVIFIYLICFLLGFSALIFEVVEGSFYTVVVLAQVATLFFLISLLMLVGRDPKIKTGV
ncbi:MAG: undecaprenyl/decaprenyl-phosphate alpha-N-acetylglucosaminyl 1-phosphate transferase [Candidatus Omnitrophica bacterium]|nr:undecaprenyl/decaprenyl-phosphate alpha-N-acetylglucosaminyl 1-phosphate transferase [Candidatus Omnitrophota bacterium]